ncbi:hypothetical protein YSA_08746 [Pseudomonas putida ND6]|uniref:Uncharacterized protein n=1 Tax=Pseudomonas putida ND6 TaxID=231023 RepID=I3V185_PSEPU|nr:hypothetical protein YSA_08746 [Pseudomonas putida ND6]
MVRRVGASPWQRHERKVERLRAVMVDASVERQVLSCGNNPGFMAIHGLGRSAFSWDSPR